LTYNIRQTVRHLRVPSRFRAYGAQHLDVLTKRAGLSDAERLAVRAGCHGLPFEPTRTLSISSSTGNAAPRTTHIPPVFPQPDMLPAGMRRIVGCSLGTPRGGGPLVAHEIRMGLNPLPAGQLSAQRPRAGRTPPCRGCT